MTQRALHQADKQFNQGMELFEQGCDCPQSGAERWGWMAAQEMRKVKSKYLEVAREEVETEEKAEVQPPQETATYKDISAMSIDEIQSEILDWVFNLKEGDEVFVMYSPLDWQVSDRSYKAVINRVTDSRVRLTKPGESAEMVQFHRKSGLQVKGVDGVGDYRLIPPWLNPKDLEEAWLAMEVIRRNATLKKIPTAKLLDILRQIEE